MRVLGVAATLALALMATACGSDDTFLPSLLADPMAAYDVPEIELVHSDAQGQGEVPLEIMGGTQVARVIRRYQVAGEDAANALEEAVNAARQTGWDMRMDQTSDERYVGEKDLEVGRGRITLAVDRDPEEPVGHGMVTLGINMVFDDLFEGDAG